MRFSWDGSYTSTAMTGELTSEWRDGGVQMRMAGTLLARRLGDCREEASPHGAD